jgi:choline dehydrogenase-like flavoprotein
MTTATPDSAVGVASPSSPVGTPSSGWSAGNFRTLTALAATFVPGADAARRASLMAQGVDRHLERSQARGLRLALTLADSRTANLLLTGHAVKFSRLDRAAREAYLASWAASRVSIRRDAFHAFRRLSTFVAYADPGPADTPNPRLRSVGYVAASEPVTSDPTVLTVEALPPGGGDVDLEADVVVVGSGAGGGVVARDLAAAGAGVLVVESGPLVTEPDMPTDELTGYDRLLLQGGFAGTWDGSIVLLAGSAVGGGTLVNWSTCLPTPDAIRAEWASEHGLDGFDGAAFDDDLAALRTDLGLAPPPWMTPKDDAILRGSSALGIEGSPTVRNAVDCGNCDGCTFGCRRGAKRSTMRVHLAEASRAGARILPDVAVQRVLIDDGRAAGVEGRSAADGRRVRVRARHVVLAAGALRTPTILRQSGVDHPAVGRNLRIHPVSAILARYDADIDAWHGPMQGARSLEFAPEFTIESAPVHPGLLASAVPWESSPEHAAIMREARHVAPLIAITRDADGGRVRPLRSGGAKVDYRLAADDVARLRKGLVEMARIAHAAGALEILAPAAVPQRWRADEGDAAFIAYLARLAAFDFRPHRGAVFSAHQMGTARMGADPATHATDPGGRVRRGTGKPDDLVRGLYVADGSLFPTGLGVNPMLTVMLLARRVGRTVAAERSAGG